MKRFINRYLMMRKWERIDTILTLIILSVSFICLLYMIFYMIHRGGIVLW